MTAPPAGTVTFLFTDIEGSTKLAQAYPAEWPALQARHHAILRAAIESHAGFIFQIVGDAFCAAFPSAPDALGAAIEAQRMLQNPKAPPSAERSEHIPNPSADAIRNSQFAIRVRMGLHTGTTEFRDGEYQDYLTLAHVQRVMSAGHGGQLLLSNAAAILLSGQPPAGLTLRDLGAYQLKGLLSPEHLWQVVAPDLPSEFPPLQALQAVRTNLPLQLTSFIGRERERAEVKRLLATMRLLTLTGPGGTGKTRLSLQVAAETLDTFKDGVWFVELAPLSDPAHVAPAIAHALGLNESPGKSILEMLTDYLREKHLLLVLDNFEQVVASAPFVKVLLTSAPKLKLLISSRTLLRIAGEHEYAVPLLALPDPRHLPPLDQLTACEAVHLFIERAQAVKSGFVLTGENAPAVAQICCRLDGLPLAIELAAARVRLLPPQKMLAQLDHMLRLLVSAAPDLPARQQTLRGAIDWSFNLLAPPEQTLLLRLAVFAGGATLEAVEAVCNAQGAIDVFAGVESLVDKSLLKQNERNGEPRFVMLEILREYAWEKLAAAGELAQVRDLHLDYFLALAESGRAPSSLASPSTLGDLNLSSLEAEDDNLGAALEWGLAQQPDLSLRLAGALGSYWMVRGYLTTGRHWLTASLAHSAAAPALSAEAERARQAARVVALGWAGALANLQGDPKAARLPLAEAVSLARQLDDRQRLEMSLTMASLTAVFLDDIPDAQAMLAESIALGRALNNRADLSSALAFYTSVVFRSSGDLEAARPYFDEAVSLARELGDQVRIADTLNNWGLSAFGAGAYEEARRSYQTSMTIYEAAGNALFINISRSGLADVARRQGDHDRAQALYRESLAEWDRLGNRGAIARVLECLAFVAKARAAARAAPSLVPSLRQAALLLGAADALRTASGNPMTGAERGEYDLEVAALRALLDAPAFSAAWAEGQRLTPERAIALALEEN